MTLHWDREGLHWPHRDRSRFVAACGLRWHLQHFPRPGAPQVVLLHGTGASTHSWRGLAPALEQGGFDVLALDLPGHAYTHLPAHGSRSRFVSLSGMAAAVGELLRVLQARPSLLVGHSAGAALALRMVLDRRVEPTPVVSLNGALLPWAGLPGMLLSPLARLLAATPAVPRLFAWRASDPGVLERLLAATGSRLDPTGQALYSVLARDPDHAAGALAMMAHWDLHGLRRDLPRLAVPLVAMVGLEDRTIDPAQAQQALALLPPGRGLPLVRWPGLGHLAHEEDPRRVADALLAAWAALSAAPRD